jgi:glycosyltransferase involved in cell wall biosynthesis
MQRRKILFLLADSITKPAGGLGERFRNLLPLIVKKHDCAVFCVGDGGEFPDIPVRGVDELRPPYRSGQAFQAIVSGYINEFIDETFVPDVVVATDHGFILPAYAIARYRKSKLVVDFNLALFSFQKQYNQDELRPELRAYSDYINEAEKFGIVSASQVVLCSNYYKAELPIKPQNDALVIPNGIDVEPWLKPSPPFLFPGGFEKNLVYIGRMNTQKGVEFLFDLELPPDTALHFVGSPVASNRFDDMLKAVESKSNFFYLGSKFGDEKISLIKSAEAILFPTIHEPFGIVFLEALISKTPLITTMEGEMQTALTENECIKCGQSTQSIRESIDRLFAMSVEQKREMTERGFAVARSYSWESAAQMFCDLFDRL